MTRAQMLRAISDSFPSEDPAMVLEILDRYGPERHERERERVHLTIQVKRDASADPPAPPPRELRLVINLETATTLGVTIPPSLLRRAAELIQ